MNTLEKQIETFLGIKRREIEANRAKAKHIASKLHAEYSEIKTSLVEQISEFAQSLNEDDRKRLAKYVYWNTLTLHIGSQNLMRACGFKQLPYNIFPPLYIGFKCNECGRTWGEGFRAVADGRKDYYDFCSGKYGNPYMCLPNKSNICPTCENIQNNEHATKRVEESEQEAQEQEQRLIELKTMPYSDYLQTPEWNKRRKRAYRKASYKCQLCGDKGKGLNAHHNSKESYTRRGEEWDSDLTVLCNDCNKRFHNDGKKLGVK